MSDTTTILPDDGDLAARARQWADALRGVVVAAAGDSLARSKAALLDVADFADSLAPLAAQHAETLLTGTPAERERAKDHLKMLQNAVVQRARRHKRREVQANAERLGEIVRLFVQGAASLAGGGLAGAAARLATGLIGK